MRRPNGEKKVPPFTWRPAGSESVVKNASSSSTKALALLVDLKDEEGVSSQIGVHGSRHGELQVLYRESPVLGIVGAEFEQAQL